MKVLMTACTGLGNFLLKTPMIRKLHELFPDAKVDLIDLIYQFKQLSYELHFLMLSSDTSDLEFWYLCENGVSNLSLYSYLTCFFENIKKQNGKVKVFTSGAVLASYAVVRSNIECFLNLAQCSFIVSLRKVGC